MAQKKLQDIFVRDIIDGMSDWVRVIDRDNNMLYVNKAMSDALGDQLIGQKCFAVMGKSAPCEVCISRRATFDGHSHQKEEHWGDKIFSVMSSPLRSSNGEIIAAVEVLRDITQTKQLQAKILEQNRKLESDLHLAKTLQCSFLPKELPLEKIDFSYIYKPCESLGGDFLDIFKIDENHTGIYIADVSGHGVPASMLTIFLRAAINRKLLSPAEALKELYASFNLNSLNSDLYITIFYAIIDTQSMDITYSNAGHNVCPVVFNRDMFEILRAAGIPISDWMESPEYVDKKMKLRHGDRIFFYTDGIVERRNQQNEQFGEKRLLEVLLDPQSAAGEILNRIIARSAEFVGVDQADCPLDDITMALLEIK